MQIEDLMTEDPTCCAPDTPLRKVAQAMAESDCGALPVIEKGGGRRLLGVITDRDIVVRAVAERKPLNHVTAREIMTETPVTVGADGDVEEVREAMGENQLRRVLVADGDRACVGVVSQADLARHLTAGQSGVTLKRVSQPEGPFIGPARVSTTAAR